jgi:hypothetical protein
MGSIRGLQVDVVSTQGAHPNIAPPIVVDSPLTPGLVLARRDKVAITVNGFEHGSHDPCLESIEYRLQALLEVKKGRGRSDGAPRLGLLMYFSPECLDHVVDLCMEVDIHQVTSFSVCFTLGYASWL